MIIPMQYLRVRYATMNSKTSLGGVAQIDTVAMAMPAACLQDW